MVGGKTESTLGEHNDSEIDVRVVLVSGAHRLAAIKSLGWDWVTCLVFPADASEMDAEL